MMLHSCYDCAHEALDGCSMHLNDNGDREPVFDEPVECEYFEPKEVAEYEF